MGTTKNEFWKNFLVKKRKKIAEAIILFLIIISFSFLFGEEYESFHKNTKLELEQKNNLETKLAGFELENIREYENIEIYGTPDLSLIDEIVTKIDNSSREVYLESYIFTEKRILAALKRAKNRGADVKVVMEKNPYKAFNINNSRYKELVDAGIETAWSNPKLYSLNHSKFLIIDSLSIVSTGNFSYSKFKSNKDFLIFIRDEEFNKNLKKIFLNDFNGVVDYTYSENLVNSPHFSRNKLEILLNSAEKSIDIYLQYFGDDEMNDLLINKSREGTNIRVIVPEKYFKDEENIETINHITSEGINIRYLDNIKQHSKVFIVDKKYAFVGSINMSPYSLDKNKEVGILLKNVKVIEVLLNHFEKDFK